MQHFWWKGYLLLLLWLSLLDGIWLGWIARPFYVKHLGYIMRDVVYWPTAILFYFSYAAGVLFFVVLPALERGSTWRAFLTGGFLGFIAFMAYDFTNHATLKGFPLIVVVADIAWGIVVTSLAAGMTVFILNR